MGDGGTWEENVNFQSAVQHWAQINKFLIGKQKQARGPHPDPTSPKKMGIW